MIFRFLKYFVYSMIPFGSVFSLRYDIQILNQLDNSVFIKKDAIRELNIVSRDGQSYSFPLAGLKLDRGKSVVISVDARPYYKHEQKDNDKLLLITDKKIYCRFINEEGDVGVYPSLRGQVLSNNIKLERDAYGVGYTLVIKGTGNREESGILSWNQQNQKSDSSISSQELLAQGAKPSQQITQNSFNPDFEGIF